MKKKEEIEHSAAHIDKQTKPEQKKKMLKEKNKENGKLRIK